MEKYGKDRPGRGKNGIGLCLVLGLELPEVGRVFSLAFLSSHRKRGILKKGRLILGSRRAMSGIGASRIVLSPTRAGSHPLGKWKIHQVVG